MADAAADKKVFDVAKPGKSAPSSNSRPIIIGHKTMVEDPMVAKTSVVTEPKKTLVQVSSTEVGDASTEPSAPEAPASMPPSKRITIMPLSHDDEDVKPDGKVAVKTDAQPITEAVVPTGPLDSEPTAPEAKKAPEPAPKQVDTPKTDTDDIPDSSDTAVLDAVVEQASTNKTNKAADDADKVKQEALEKLVTSKQYYLPIDEAKHIHAVERFLAIALLVALLAAAGAYLAVDAGLIKANVNLPLDLIKN